MKDGDATTWHKTACILCENNCGIQVQLDGRRLAKIRGDKEHVSSQGYTCNKALRLDHYQNGGTRLTSPVRREKDGSYTEISWDTAVREVAQRLDAVRKKHGGETIFFYGGGGQGNHLGGAYSRAFLGALGSKYRSNPLAQEKTGEAWVDAHFTGGHTHGDFEHAEVSLFIGKNPWQSHGVSRARTVLKQIAASDERQMIVIDPVRSDTAEMADIHLQLRPGTDAWCLAAILGVIVHEDLIDHEFIAAHTSQSTAVLAELAAVDVSSYAAICGLDEDLVRSTARVIAAAGSVSTYEDLGVQQSPNSTLVSYLNKLIWILTGNFAKSGGMQPHSWLAPLARYDTSLRRTPVTGAAMPVGLVPCNVIAEEILTDHPKRFRAMVIDSSNPAHSLAGSATFRQALDELDMVVVVDVAMTETARHADYVLPAASQFEKWEATFFTFEFPDNTFQLRAPLMPPLEGTLPEPEIYARLVRELGIVSERRLTILRIASRLGLTAHTAVLFTMIGLNRKMLRIAPYLMYETLDRPLPAGGGAAAALWALALRVSLRHRKAMRRAGHRNAKALFRALLDNRSGAVFTRDRQEDAWTYTRQKDNRFPLVIQPLLKQLAALPFTKAHHTTDEFPFILAAGQRRAFTANTIFHDDSWRMRDKEGALQINPEDAADIGLAAGNQARVVTSRGEAVCRVELTDRLQRGNIALPNGFGLDLTSDADSAQRVGVALNALTDATWREPTTGNPWHKHVPARVERVEHGR